MSREELARSSILFYYRSVLLPYIHFVINDGTVPPWCWCRYAL